MQQGNKPPAMSQTAYATHRDVSRKTVTVWKQQGLLVFTTGGLIDVAATDAILNARPERYRGGVTSAASVTSCNAGGNQVTKPWPPAYSLLNNIEDPFNQGAAAFALQLFYHMDGLASALAISAGASCKVAFSAGRTMQMAVLYELTDYLKEQGVDVEQINFVHMKSIPAINWPNLAMLAGEEVDIPAWEAHHEAMANRVD
jgi:hypothetical protein